MIISAVSLWKKYEIKTPRDYDEWGVELIDGVRYSHVSYEGHVVEDGAVRIYARFSRPITKHAVKLPTLLLLPDLGKRADDALLTYFNKKGYAVLALDYCSLDAEEEKMHTVFPPSLYYGEYDSARGLYDMENLPVDKSSWFEWTHVALTSIEYLKTRRDVGDIGVIGFGLGGELCWPTMFSSDIKCGIPVNAVGWLSFRNAPKFGAGIERNMKDDRLRYIAAIEAQSYAPYVKCPVLMLCAMRDKGVDCDRAYDTYTRIGVEDVLNDVDEDKFDLPELRKTSSKLDREHIALRVGKGRRALVYSSESGGCIDGYSLHDIDLFLEKHLLGREIFIPNTLHIKMKENVGGGVEIKVRGDEDGLIEEIGIYYAEGDADSRAAYRDWRCVYKTKSSAEARGEIVYKTKPFAASKGVFAYAYAKYFNGFYVSSRISCIQLVNPNPAVLRNRMLYSGTEKEAFTIADYNSYSVDGVLLKEKTQPVKSLGYGGISGVYAVGGVCCYRLSNPEFYPPEDSILQFQVYSAEEQWIKVTVEPSGRQEERYSATVFVEGGGKWKSVMIEPLRLKGEQSGRPLESFRQGSALTFACAEEEKEFVVTNVLWL